MRLAQLFALSAVVASFACGAGDALTAVPEGGSAEAVRPMSAREILSVAGCTRDAVPGAPVARFPDDAGIEIPYACPGLTREQLTDLRISYTTAMSRRNRLLSFATAGAPPEGGYWTYPGYFREYCLVNLPTYEIVRCGLYYWEWLPPEWVPSPTSPFPTYEPIGGGNPGSAPAPGETPVDSLNAICPDLNPGCHTKLSKDDSTKISDSFRHRRPSRLAWSDSVAKQRCDSAFTLLGLIWGPPKVAPFGVWRGANDDSKYGVRGHHGAGGSGRIHIDPWILDSVDTEAEEKELLRTLLHEAMHAAFDESPAGEHPEPDINGNVDYSNTEFFWFIESKGANSCVMP